MKIEYYFRNIVSPREIFSSRIVWLGCIGLILLGMLFPVARSHGAPVDPPAAYALAPNDLLEIRVFQEDDLTSRLRVSSKGTINFPLIGVVSVGGLTPQEAAESIREKLAKDYLVNPQVAVTVYDYGKRRFSVLGEVQKAGTYDMPEREKVTLLDAIAMAGGYTRIADPAKITLKRKEAGKEKIVRLNAKAMARDDRVTSYEVQPGDVITVGESIF